MMHNRVFIFLCGMLVQIHLISVLAATDKPEAISQQNQSTQESGECVPEKIPPPCNEGPWKGGFTIIQPENYLRQSFLANSTKIYSVDVSIMPRSNNYGGESEVLTVRILDEEENTLCTASKEVRNPVSGWERFTLVKELTVKRGQKLMLELVGTGKMIFAWKYSENLYRGGERILFKKQQLNINMDWLFRVNPTAAIDVKKEFPLTGSVQPTRAISSIMNIQRGARWSGVVYLDRDVVVSRDATLTIAPGTVILIASQLDYSQTGMYKPLVEIRVFGTLLAQGKEDNPIVFYAIKEPVSKYNQSHGMQITEKTLDDYLPVNIRNSPLCQSSLWGGIQFEPKSSGTMAYCVIANAVDAVFADTAHPALNNCVLRDCENGISGGKRSGLKHDNDDNLVCDDSVETAGGYANPIIANCFIFRCHIGASFVNNCAPIFRDTVITDCHTGILNFNAMTAQTKITGCVFSKITAAIDSRKAVAIIRNNVCQECKRGVMITDHTVPPSFVVEGNTFPFDPYSFSLYDQTDGKVSIKSLKLTFTNNTFQEVTFKDPNYLYPPAGDWQCSNNSNNKANADPAATFYGHNIMGTNILFLLDISGARGTKTIVSHMDELKKMLGALTTTSSCKLNFIWSNQGRVSKNIGINLRTPNATEKLTAEIDRLYANGVNSARSEALWNEAFRIIKSEKFDVIYFLSDAKYEMPIPISNKLFANNELNKLVINTIAIGSEQPLLKRIARARRGNYIYVQQPVP